MLILISMMDKRNIKNKAISDHAIMEKIGAFIKQQRLEQNKTQIQLALDAGINRSTLVDLEQGKSGNLITFIQVLRALNYLDVFEHFEIKTKISPIQLAELEMAKRQRASKSKLSKPKPKSTW